MTDDLLSRLTAAVDEAERVASNAARGPWRQQGQYVEQESIYVIDPGHVDEPDARHIASWSPDVALRHVEHARKVMSLATELCDSPTPLLALTGQRLLAELAAAWGVEP